MSGPSKETQENKPWGPQEEAYKRLFAAGEAAFGATPKDPFTGDLYADPTEAQRTGVDWLKGLAPGLGSGVDLIRDLATKTVRGDFLKPESNPFLSSMLQVALDPVTKAFTEVALPSIEDASIAAGAYGGASQNLLKQAAAADFSKAGTDATTKIAYDNYLRERGNQMAAPQLFSDANTFATAPAEAMLAAGDLEQRWGQGELDSNYQKWLDLQEAPWRGLDKLAGILGAGGFGTSVRTKESNPLAEIIQGLSGVAGLAGSFMNPAAGLGQLFRPRTGMLY